jgi:tetratricopeptide (TPR) repeat protein
MIGMMLTIHCVRAEDGVKQRLSRSEQRKFDYFFYEGIRLDNSEKYDAALDMFKHCLEIDSTSSAALYELSSFYIQLNQPETAVRLMKKCISYAPDNQEYHSILATLLFETGMFGEAADEYEVLVKASPEKAELHGYLAESYTRMGEIGKAIETYDALENVMGMLDAISMEKFRLYMSLQQPDEAFRELEKLADKFPMESRYPIIIGDSYLKQNNDDKALIYYRKAYEIDPQSPYYPVSMANYFEKKGLRDSSKVEINKALVNQRLDVNTKLNILARFIVQLQRSSQDIESANTLFQTLLEQHPDETRLKLAFGEFLATQGKTDEARFQYKLITESEPENLNAWISFVRISIQTGDMDEVMRICEKAQSIFPETIEFYFFRAIACSQKGDYHKAIEILSVAIPMVPAENPLLVSELYGQKGDNYFRLKDVDKAFEAYEEALKHNDRNILVLNNYAYYLSLLKRDLAKAERMSAICVKVEPENATYIDTYAWVFFVRGNYTLAKIYIEQAISKDLTKSAELFDHYGDILFLAGDKEKAVSQWIRAKEAGKKSETLDKKIEEKIYYEESEDELLNNTNETANET